MMDVIIDDVKNLGGKFVDKNSKTFGAKFDKNYIAEEYNLSSLKEDELKNLKPLEKHLIEYAKNEDIHLFMLPHNETEMFVSTHHGFKGIFLCPKDIEDKDDNRMITFAHELGHYIDFKYNFGYDSYEFGEQTNTDENMIASEVIAWKYAEIILEALGFNEKEKFMHEMNEALDTYTEETEYKTEEAWSISNKLLTNRFHVKQLLKQGK